MNINKNIGENKMTNLVVLVKDLSINLSKLNRHGFFTLATGSGKTVT